MTLMDFPLSSADALDALSVSGPHSIEVGHLDSRPDTARIPLQLSVQLPAHYVVAALFGEWPTDDLETPEQVRDAVAVSLFNSRYTEIEDKAYDIAAGRVTCPDDLEWIEGLRVKVAEAFAPCDPWAMPVIASTPEPEPLAVIPYACDPN